MTTTRIDPHVPTENRLIYALDGMTLAESIAQVRRLRDVVKIYKVGPALIYEDGLRVANQIVKAGNGGNVQVFLDMKTWDIPETVLNAIDTIEKFGGDAVVFATVHTFNVNLRKLIDAKKHRKFKIFAITLLTSQDEGDLKDLGISLSVEDYVLYMAKRAQEFGCDGVICSGLEAKRLKQELGKQFRVITPAVRPSWAIVAGDDQKRIVTPRQAILNGADYIVVGRPIRMAPDPVQAAQSIRNEIEKTLAEMRSAAEPDHPGRTRMLAAG